jgi:hypothetical protein
MAISWPVMLSREYTNLANQQAAAAARQGGFRLAELLRAIFENR